MPSTTCSNNLTPTSRAAGTARRKVRVGSAGGQRHPCDVQDAVDEKLPAGPVTVHPLKSFPLIKDLVHRRLPQLRGEPEIPPFTAAPDDGHAVADPQQDIDRLYEFSKCISLPLPGRLPHFLRSHITRIVLWTAILSFAWRRWRCIRRMSSIAANRRGEQGGLGYCNITKCCPRCAPSTSPSR